MKRGVFLFIIFLAVGLRNVNATHNRAGEITYEFTGPNTIKATITTYTKESSLQADRDSLPMHWGDGSIDDILLRTNGALNGNGIPGGESLGNDIKRNIYIGTHIYAGAPPPPHNYYIISMTDPNRNSDIINIDNSVNVPFYIEDTIFYPTNIQNIGLNHSPLLTNPPIDFANVGDTFFHNPGAHDIDGDSLDFQQVFPKQGIGQDVPGYRYPYQIIAGASNHEFLNVHTGQYTWAVPQETGTYNVAFVIREFRRGYLLSTIVRDMQIIVNANNNHPPHISPPLDTCIRAGDILIRNVTATDPDAGQLVTLSADGGSMAVPDSLSPSTFPTVVGNPVNSTYTWNTVCLDIRGQPYEVVFKAQDNYPNTPLVDLKPWFIQVIAPPPLNLRAAVVHKKVQLSWHTYMCDSISTFRGFSIWKKIGTNPFIPAYCETGLAGRGYTRIASGVFDTTYTDVNVVHGQQLCYRILAHFSKKSPNGLYEYDAVVSVPSNEDCIYLPFDVPVITNVSVTQTDKLTGQMYLEWTKPKVGGTNLDTIQSPPTYRFDLYRGYGFSLSNPIKISSVSRSSFAALIDTTYIDTNINTTDSAYSYKVLFFSNTDTIGATNVASSVYLKLTSSDRKLRLAWQFDVPWIQDTFQIYRRDFSTGSVFNYIHTVSTTAYIDTGLTNDSTYCYFVRAFGHYTSLLIKKPLINDSEIKCGVPIDTIAPCPPVVNINNDCAKLLGDSLFTFINRLGWYNYSDSCGSDVVKYKIYYAPDSGTMTLIDSIVGINDTTYQHLLYANLAGCYVVTALDRVGNESAKTNRICIDDCPLYDLPNTFTPNGDGQNDYFMPIRPYRFITRIEIKIFNRWGEKLFETTDPDIKWDGRDQQSGKDVSEGVYFYAGYYYEKSIGGEIKKTLPHKSGGGFIHLIRGK